MLYAPSQESLFAKYAMQVLGKFWSKILIVVLWKEQKRLINSKQPVDYNLTMHQWYYSSYYVVKPYMLERHSTSYTPFKIEHVLIITNAALTRGATCPFSNVLMDVEIPTSNPRDASLLLLEKNMQ
jgi:hypothetical protein